jgi:hypothetical protein
MRRLLIVALALLASATASAQTPTKRPVSQGAVTPADMTQRLEKAALRTSEQAERRGARIVDQFLLAVERRGISGDRKVRAGAG